MRRLIIFLLGVWAVVGCDRSDQIPEFALVAGRDDGEVPYTRPLLYRIQVPAGWQRSDSKGSLRDSRLPLCTFLIEEEVTLVLHNFPESGTIPPQAQVARWKRQFDHLDGAVTTVTPQAFGGFVGLLLDAEGTKDGAPLAMMAWAMQPAPEHRAVLGEVGQRAADYTIKVTGPPDQVDRVREMVVAAARTFELIGEIPLLL